MATQKRRSFSLKQKIEIINAYETHPLKCKNVICEKYDISRSTLNTFLRFKDKHRKEYESSVSDIHRKRTRHAQHGDVDVALLDWFTEKRCVSFFFFLLLSRSIHYIYIYKSYFFQTYNFASLSLTLSLSISLSLSNSSIYCFAGPDPFHYNAIRISMTPGIFIMIKL